MPELPPVTIELALALRAGHPKYFCHGASWYQRIKNPKSEYRNSKQTQNKTKSEIRIPKSETNLKSNKLKTRRIRILQTPNLILSCLEHLVRLSFINLNLFRVSDFVLRVFCSQSFASFAARYSYLRALRVLRGEYFSTVNPEQPKL